MKRKPRPYRPAGAAAAKTSSEAATPPPIPSDVLPARLSSYLLLGGTVVIAALLGLDLYLTDRRIGFPLDETLLRLREAALLAEGGTFDGLADGGLAASSSPLWVLLLSLPSVLGVNALASALALSAASLVLAGHATARLAQRLTRRSEIAVLSAAALLVAGPAAWASFSGLEALAFAAAALYAIDLALVEARSTTRGHAIGLGIVLGVAALLRVEGLALAAVVFLLACRKEGSGWRAPPWPALVAFTAVVAPFFAYAAYAHGGLPFGLGLRGLLDDAGPSDTTARIDGWRTLLLASPVLALGLVPGLPVAARGLHRDAGARLLFGALVALVVGPVVLGADPSVGHGHALLPALPFALIAGALGVSFVIDRLRIAESSRKPLVRILFLVVLIVGAQGAWRSMRVLADDGKRFFEIELHLARWAAQRTPADARIAADPTGALGYLAKRRILDLTGLHSPEVARALRSRPAGQRADQAVWPIVARERPAFLVVRPARWPDLTARPDFMEPAYWRKADAEGERPADRVAAYKLDWSRYVAPEKPLRLEQAERLVSDARAAVREKRADAAWSAVQRVQRDGPNDRSLRQRLYVAWAETALARDDCAEARRAVLFLDWLDPPDSFRSQVGLTELERRAVGCRRPH